MSVAMMLEDVFLWKSAKGAAAPLSVCATRDVFTARWSRLLTGHVDAPLLAAVVGEIGNNCFDHNLGQWQAEPGCWFAYKQDDQAVWVVLADHGQGVRSSLHQAAPDLHTDQEFLEAAFARQISGRVGEQRGNGLKFVRQVINCSLPRGLLCHSGEATVSFGAAQQIVTDAYAIGDGRKHPMQGTLTLIYWELA